MANTGGIFGRPADRGPRSRANPYRAAAPLEVALQPWRSWTLQQKTARPAGKRLERDGPLVADIGCAEVRGRDGRGPTATRPQPLWPRPPARGTEIRVRGRRPARGDWWTRFSEGGNPISWHQNAPGGRAKEGGGVTRVSQPGAGGFAVGKRGDTSHARCGGWEPRFTSRPTLRRAPH